MLKFSYWAIYLSFATVTAYVHNYVNYCNPKICGNTNSHTFCKYYVSYCCFEVKSIYQLPTHCIMLINSVNHLGRPSSIMCGIRRSPTVKRRKTTYIAQIQWTQELCRRWKSSILSSSLKYVENGIYNVFFCVES